ncbi:MAG: hypothetical protein ABIU87_07135 [Ornithinibacter sp.]
MAPKGGRRRKQGPNRSATRGRTEGPLQPVPPSQEDADLVAALRTVLRSSDQTAATTLISSMIALTDAFHPEGGPFGDPLPLEDIIEALAAVPFAETTAALHVIAALLPDELDAARVRRALGTRRHPVPDAVLGVRDIVVEQAAKMGDELADGDNIILGLSWPGIGPVTVVVYVDEAFGTRVKDVFLIPQHFDEVCERYRELLADGGRRPTDLAAIAPADARAGIRMAIDLGDADDAPLTPESWSDPDEEPLGWPGARPFVEMLLRRMPGGGVPVLTSASLPEMSASTAAADFLTSTHSAALADREMALECAVVLANDAAQHAGHPLRWSPVQVELALTQRLPWASDATEEDLAAVAQVLPPFIRHAHERLGVPEEATAETLAAVDEWMPAFEALRVAAAVVRWRDVSPMIEALEAGDPGPLLMHRLAEEVGGQQALDALDAEPLPAEPLDLDRVAADVRDAVAEVSALVDGWLDSSPRVTHLGPAVEEWRTAARRLLVGATVKDPGWIRRRAAANGRACGLLWASGVANQLVGQSGAVLNKDLASDLGVKGSPSTRAESLIRAWNGNGGTANDTLGDAGLLIASQRAEIIRIRDADRR